MSGAAQKLPLGQRHLAMLREIMMPIEGFTITYLYYDAQDGLPCLARDPEFPEELRSAVRLA
eukprot:14264090-Alexandrium_andersonii.AAC.1